VVNERSVQPPPSTPDAQLRWLVDRACISDLLVEFARRVDAHDFAGMSELYVDGGVLRLPLGDLPKHEIAPASDRIIGVYGALHHMSTNHAIAIHGDEAQSRSYLQAAHVRDASEPGRHGDVGGWYDCTYRRTKAGWRFVDVRLTFVWTLGADLPGGDRG
jgi:hypothetical protein